MITGNGGAVVVPINVITPGPPVPPELNADEHPVLLQITLNVIPVSPLNPEDGNVTDPSD